MASTLEAPHVVHDAPDGLVIEGRPKRRHRAAALLNPGGELAVASARRRAA
jgi:hypothetical protein